MRLTICSLIQSVVKGAHPACWLGLTRHTLPTRARTLGLAPLTESRLFSRKKKYSLLSFRSALSGICWIFRNTGSVVVGGRCDDRHAQPVESHVT